MHDIIPDIHGQAAKLRDRLQQLGYRDRQGAYRHSDADRQCIFLGDYIDRGPENAAVIDIIRRMVDSGTAQAIMGNHELNAIQYHTAHPETGEPLRARSEENQRQHGSFLEEYPVGQDRTKDVIAWMQTLPLFVEFDGFRVVHACWDDHHIATLRQHTDAGVLTDDLIYHAADRDHPLYSAVETTAKGPEYKLPDGYVFHDKDGTPREDIRVKWWVAQPDTWQDVAMSVPNPGELPNGSLPAGVVARSYSTSGKPVFFGHYWLNGSLHLQSPNALCLDYSAGKDGPLVAYRSDGSSSEIDLDNVSGHETTG